MDCDKTEKDYGCYLFCKEVKTCVVVCNHEVGILRENYPNGPEYLICKKCGCDYDEFKEVI